MGAVVGPESVICIDARATPTAAGVARRARRITDKPVEWLVLTHAHAVPARASASDARHVVAHGDGGMIRERRARPKARAAALPAPLSQPLIGADASG